MQDSPSLNNSYTESSFAEATSEGRLSPSPEVTSTIKKQHNEDSNDERVGENEHTSNNKNGDNDHDDSLNGIDEGGKQENNNDNGDNGDDNNDSTVINKNKSLSVISTKINGIRESYCAAMEKQKEQLKVLEKQAKHDIAELVHKLGAIQSELRQVDRAIQQQKQNNNNNDIDSKDNSDIDDASFTATKTTSPATNSTTIAPFTFPPVVYQTLQDLKHKVTDIRSYFKVESIVKSWIVIKSSTKDVAKVHLQPLLFHGDLKYYPQDMEFIVICLSNILYSLGLVASTKIIHKAHMKSMEQCFDEAAGGVLHFECFFQCNPWAGCNLEHAMRNLHISHKVFVIVYDCTNNLDRMIVEEPTLSTLFNHVSIVDSGYNATNTNEQYPTLDFTRLLQAEAKEDGYILSNDVIQLVTTLLESKKIYVPANVADCPMYTMYPIAAAFWKSVKMAHHARRFDCVGATTTTSCLHTITPMDILNGRNDYIL